jgi:hypothetical protein
MEGAAYSAICDATFMLRRIIRVPFRLHHFLMIIYNIQANHDAQAKSGNIIFPGAGCKN